MKLTLGSTIGRYTVEEMVGEGGMATVYRVRHNELHATYALKVLHLVSDAIQRRLVQEGRVQARLRHPNILPVTDILDVGGRPGLIMEYVPGPSLENHLATRHLPLDEADQIGQGILSAVAFAHNQGCIHRDLKPANILLADIGGEYIPKVADFGLVKVIDAENDSLHKTRTGIGIGTPCYMAPEQALDAAHVDERADVFSLGAILYELVCGRRAFHGPNSIAIILRIAGGDFTPPEELKPDLPERFLDAIHGAMQIDRNQRIQDCQTLREVWRGKQRWHAPSVPTPDATWSDEDVMASADAGVAGLQDIIRSISRKSNPAQPRPAPRADPAPQGEPAAAQPPRAPTADMFSAAPATAVPPEPEPEPPPPPRLPTMDLGSVPASQPDPEPTPPHDSGTLADDLALELNDGADSISEALLSAEPEELPPPPAPATPERPPTPQAVAFPAPPATPKPQVVSPEPERAAEEEPERRGVGLLPKLMAAAGLLLALGLGGAVVATFVVLNRQSMDPHEQVAVGDEPSPLAAVLAEPDELAEEPAATTAPPSAVAQPSATEPLAEPVPRSEPDPKIPEVKAAPPPLRTGTVTVSGDMVSVALIAKNGRRRPPGVVPVGTYDLQVGFANGKTVTRSAMVEVTADATVEIRCSSRVENCR